MIKIIDSFTPLETLDDQTDFLTEHEDVYFTMGCIKINLPIGDDDESSYFALHTIYHDKCFGLHQPNDIIKKHLYNSNEYLKYLNLYLKL